MAASFSTIQAVISNHDYRYEGRLELVGAGTHSLTSPADNPELATAPVRPVNPRNLDDAL